MATMETRVWMALVAVLCSLPDIRCQPQQLPVEYNIMEELPNDTLIGNVATDSDLSSRYDAATLHVLTYSFLSLPSQEHLLFNIEPSGVIRTAKKIDRDVICAEKETCTLSMNVAVGPAQFFQIITVNVDILDKNDNAPAFEESTVEHHISESTMPESGISLPMAVDPDSPVFGIQRYDVTPKTDMFGLTMSQGLDGAMEVKLILKKRLDREQTDRYELTLLAYDGGMPDKSGSVTIVVLVDDTNDNHPEFVNATSTVSVPEDYAVDRTIIQVVATDKDVGVNADIMYGFSKRTESNFGSVFGIHADSGVIYLKDHLDYETTTKYQLVVSAVDKGAEAKPAHATVLINVKDVNDNPPHITVNTLAQSNHAQVSEKSEIRTFVAHVSVVDPDSGVSGQVTCRLEDQSFQLQKMHEYQYKVVTDSVYDREERDQYQLQVECEDQGVPALRSVYDLIVDIMDVNDHAPEFLRSPYSGSVMENNVPGKHILQINVTDRDVGENAAIVFSLSDDAPEEFQIDPITGIIRAAKSVDREKMKFAEFSVVATDKGKPPRSSSASVTITVTDVNDEIPHFSQTVYSFGTFENKELDSEVGIVHAYDQDSVPFNQVQYGLRADDHETLDRFRIEPETGRIITRQVLDREQKSVYYMTATAFNPGASHRSSTVSVTVYVADENDHDPVIDFPSQFNATVRVSNLVPRRYVITRIRAHDDDIGNSAKLTYYIVGGNQDRLFDMDDITGAVTVSVDLDGELEKVFNLTVLVCDGGVLPRNTSATLTVDVTSAVALPASVAEGAFRTTKPKKGFNSTIVVVVGCLSGLIIVALVIAIVAIRMQDARRQNSARYNCRTEAQKMLHQLPNDGRLSPEDNTTPQASPNNLYDPCAQFSVAGRDLVLVKDILGAPPNRTGTGQGCSRHSSFLEKLPSTNIDGGSTKSRSIEASKSRPTWGSAVTEPVQAAHTSPVTYGLVQEGQGEGHSNPGSRSFHANIPTEKPTRGAPPPPPPRAAYRGDGGPPERPPRPHDIQMQHLRGFPTPLDVTPGGGDGDSSCSNADSGRGGSEEGEGQHNTSGQIGNQTFDSSSDPELQPDNSEIPSNARPATTFPGYHANHPGYTMAVPKCVAHGPPPPAPPRTASRSVTFAPAPLIGDNPTPDKLNPRLNSDLGYKTFTGFPDDAFPVGAAAGRGRFSDPRDLKSSLKDRSVVYPEHRIPYADDTDTSFTDTNVDDDASSATSGTYVVDPDELAALDAEAIQGYHGHGEAGESMA